MENWLRKTFHTFFWCRYRSDYQHWCASSYSLQVKVHIKRHLMHDLPEKSDDISQWCKNVFEAKVRKWTLGINSTISIVELLQIGVQLLLVWLDFLWTVNTYFWYRTFDPLSERPSSRDSWITMADFRLCSTSRSHSYAGLNHYAHEQNRCLSLPSYTSVTL